MPEVFFPLRELCVAKLQKASKKHIFVAPLSIDFMASALFAKEKKNLWHLMQGPGEIFSLEY